MRAFRFAELTRRPVIRVSGGPGVPITARPRLPPATHRDGDEHEMSRSRRERGTVTGFHVVALPAGSVEVTSLAPSFAAAQSDSDGHATATMASAPATFPDLQLPATVGAVETATLTADRDAQ
jgi:hypothetical protein